MVIIDSSSLVADSITLSSIPYSCTHPSLNASRVIATRCLCLVLGPASFGMLSEGCIVKIPLIIRTARLTNWTLFGSQLSALTVFKAVFSFWFCLYKTNMHFFFFLGREVPAASGVEI